VKIQYKRKLHVSNKKTILWLAAIIIVLLVMVYFDKQKVYKEEKPPIPVVSLGEQKTQVLLGSFTWNGREVKRELKDLEESLNYKRVNIETSYMLNFQKVKNLYIYHEGYTKVVGKS
jgi:hypothetical protein